MTITLHWWLVPVGMVVATFLLWWHGSRESGMMGGIVQFLFGAGLLIGAIATALVGWLK